MFVTKHIHCVDCGYDLYGLSRDLCPECGRSFDPADIATFAEIFVSRRRAVLITGGLSAVLALSAVAGIVAAGGLGALIGYEPLVIMGPSPSVAVTALLLCKHTQILRRHLLLAALPVFVLINVVAFALSGVLDFGNVLFASLCILGPWLLVICIARRTSPTA